MMRTAAGAARVVGWDGDLPVDAFSDAQRKALAARLYTIVANNPFHTSTTTKTSSFILAASDASSDGYGGIAWNADRIIEIDLSFATQQCFPDDMKPAHIFIKEMYAAMRLIQRVCEAQPRSAIMLGVDNTAVVFALTNRYSGNGQANEMIQRVETSLSSAACELIVFPITSEENPADPASRGVSYCLARESLFFKAWEANRNGFGKAHVTLQGLSPLFQGGVRHVEPSESPEDDQLLEALEDAEHSVEE
jgi:hypothetical protein